MIEIVCKKTEGFYRGGKKHPAGLTSYPDGTFTPDQLARIKSEPLLQVRIVPDSPAAVTGQAETPDPQAVGLPLPAAGAVEAREAKEVNKGGKEPAVIVKPMSVQTPEPVLAVEARKTLEKGGKENDSKKRS